MQTYRTLKFSLLILVLMVLAFSFYGCRGATTNDFLVAIHQVETSGRTGPILGDNGKALGPFQIHYAYWKDSGVQGSYKQCADLSYSRRVVVAYLNRYCREAYIKGDWETCARVHNGGPKGYQKAATEAYWKRVKTRLKV